MALRWDTVRIDKFARTPAGGLRIPATPARIGVQTYVNPDGSTRKEFRPPEEVFSADSLASLAHAPVTHMHPEGGRVTPENYRATNIGHVSHEVGHTDEHVTTDLLVEDAGAISGVERGDLVELSCGYTCDTVAEPGEFNGERYDFVQRNIRQNHVALLPSGWGRGGSTVALRLDAMDPPPAAHAPPPKEPMKITIDGKEFDKGSDEHLAALETKHAKDRSDAYSAAKKHVARRAVLASYHGAVKGYCDARGYRFDAPPPPEDGEAKDEGNIFEKLIGTVLPGFDFAQIANVSGPEAALLVILTMMQDDEGAEEEPMADVVGPSPGDANAGTVPAGNPGRADGFPRGNYRAAPRTDAAPQLSAYELNAQRSLGAWKGGAK